MAKTRLRQEEQIKNSDSYDDSLVSGPTLETGALTIEDDLNAIRSQLKRLVDSANWYDEPAAGGSGWIYAADVTVTGGTASSKTYQDDPANTVLQSVTVSAATFSVVVRSSYPLVEVNGVPGELARDPVGGFYSGSVEITLSASGDVALVALTADGEDGATDTLAVTLDLPPNITSALFTGPYPTGPGGLQTELKENDAFSIAIVADKSFNLVEILAFGASQFVSTAVTPGLSAVVQIQAADQGDVAQLLAARVRVRDTLTAAFSATRDTNLGGGTTNGIHVVNLNDLRPSGAVTSIVYPPAQAALKGVESATVLNTASDFNSILYSDPTGAQISIASTATFEASKTVTALGSGVFNNTATNFRYLMTRNPNGAQTTVNAVVVIADVAPTITVSTPAARLRSGGNNGTSPQDYTVTLTSNQPLLSTPTLGPAAGGNKGTFTTSFAGGPSVWTRTFRINETIPDLKGTFSWTSMLATGLAGLTQSTIGTGSTYTLGGFVQRTLVFAAFATTTSLGTEVVTFSKLTAGIFTATSNTALKQPIGTSPPVTDGYTIDATGVNPTTLIWLDTAAAGSNSSGLASITLVEETV
jgi:hypothetical protein